MTSVTPRVPSPDLAEGLSERTLANIRLIIGSRLRDEDLRVIKQFRDNSMQMMGHDSDITRICRQQQQLFWERTWHKHLQTLRRDLPKTINEILDGLEKEFEDRKVPTPPALEHEQHDSTPLTPQSASKERSREELPMPEPVAKPAGLSVAPMAPMTPMEGVVLEDGNESIRSFTMPITSPVESPSKRPLDHAESSKSANKRTKSAEQDNDRLLTLDELKEFECIFRYPGHEGFYVLRCERDRCRKSCGQDMIWFDSDPFRWQRAMAHFSIYGHGVKDEAKAFQKYAWRVIDATEERKLTPPPPSSRKHLLINPLPPRLL
ncbi:hypothetical protein F4775DRAFT_414419 [Biscogniauxia sp. FL1348]|nr:hypothetical protein F4775DRAFT_414419 [Biscogniauxia sp. FL1348]